MARAAHSDKNVRIREFTVTAHEGQLGRVRDFMVEACQEAAFSERETSNTKLAVDEACTNIIKHAYDSSGQGEITVRVQIEPGNLRISLYDQGKRFDYASIQDPDLDEYVETGRKGGLGVYLINRLMDGVEYHAGETGNELVLSKRSQSAVSRGLLPEAMPFRDTLRFRFMLRASAGLLLLVAAIWAFVFIRQTSDTNAQRATQWLEKRRLAENLSNRSKDVLIRPDEFSVEQTNLSTYLSKLLGGNEDLAYVRVVGANGDIVSSGDIDEIFTPYREPLGAVLLGRDDRVEWKGAKLGGRDVRDIRFAVRVTNPDTGQPLELGWVHLGVFDDAIEAHIKDPRLTVTLILIGVFLVGLLLIMGLVSVFVKPIQVLTDGVRAIGDGTLDAKLDVGGPAEIGAIAGVFNEITNKFKKAQESVLEQEKMQKEMEVAKEIQHSLLPRRKPEVSGYDIAPLYQAAAEVGGDYYDFVDVGEDTIGVVVADVSGKGVPGSLVMTMIRTALRMEARGNTNASDVMSKMNAFVTDDMKKGMFVTMFYVILDSKNRIISYASAGHNPMILYRHETNETFFLNPKGFPVGISLPDESLFRKSISLEKIKLKKDDMLLIYTDGVTEAMNERREQFGEERLINCIKENGQLHPEDFISALELEIKKFTGGHPQNDDITVVAVKEKQSADDVLFGIRKKLIDLVDVKGLSVKEACRQMRVSPATYYRYKKRLEVMGERGLKDKVLRQDTVLKRVSLEARKELLDIVIEHPDYGAKRLADEYNANKPNDKQLTIRMVYDELKRLNLNTKELRLDYLRRNRLLKEEMLEEAGRLSGKEIVEELLKEIPGVEAGAEDEAAPTEEVVAEAESLIRDRERPAGSDESTIEFEQIDGVGVSVSESEDGVTTVEVNGHLDSVTSASLEQQLKQLISGDRVKFIVDLSDVTYISSGGWGIFTGEVRHLRENGGDVVLVGMSPEVYDVYELLGFNEVLKAFATLEEGHEFFAMSPEERMTVPSTPAQEKTVKPLSEEIELEEEVPGEGYVPEWESLRIEGTTVGAKGDIAVLSLGGIIDTVSAETLRTALAKVIEGGRYRVVVDMSQVEYVSSGGWGTFTERLREVRRNYGDIKLFGMDPDVYYVFTMLGFNIVLSSFDILAEAIEDFERDAKPAEGNGDAVDATEATGQTEPNLKTARRTRDAVSRGSDTLDVDLGTRDVGDIVIWEKVGEDVLIAHLSGYVEAAAVNVLATSMMQEIAITPRAVVFDLTNARYISSTGWGQFAKCYETVREWGGEVCLYGLSSDLHDIYSCLEFQAFIKDYPDRDAALEAVAAALDRESAGAGAPSGTGAGVAPPETDGAPPPEPTSDVADYGVEEDESEALAEEDETEAPSVDDVLGASPEDTELSPASGAAPPGPEEDHRWPGEHAEDKREPAGWPGEAETGPELADTRPAPDDEDREQDGTPPDADEKSPQSVPSGEPDKESNELERRFVDMSDRVGGVDVGLAVSDKNIDRDEQIRRQGWQRYGEKLKRRNARRKKKEKED